jgi:hypothetical protein
MYPNKLYAHQARLKQKTDNGYGIVFRLGPFKSFILQPLRNANFLGPPRLQDEGFERIKFLRILKAKSGFTGGRLSVLLTT